MTVLDLTARTSSGSSENRAILPTDKYKMKIVDAKIEEDKFAEPNKDGTKPVRLVLTWEMSSLTEEQQDAAAEAGEDWNGVRVWQRLNPYYGTVKAGGPSKFKAFLDGLLSQGLLPNFSEEAFDIKSLEGIEQYVFVERYAKTMGDNAGQPGNKVVSTAALPKRRAKPAPVAAPAEEDDGY